MFCSNCGAALSDDAKFCTSCGAPVPVRIDEPMASSGESAQMDAEAPVLDEPAKLEEASMPKRKGLRPAAIAVIAIAVVAVLVGGVVLAWRFVFDAPARKSTIERVELERPVAEGDATAEGTGAEDGGSTSTSDEADVASADDTGADSSSSASSSGDVDEPSSDASSSQDYMLPNSSSELISEQDLEDLSDWELYIARNEIYARHGRGFSNKDLQEYFGSKSWYVERYTPEEFDANPTLSDIELQNVETIHNVEKARGSSHA